MVKFSSILISKVYKTFICFFIFNIIFIHFCNADQFHYNTHNIGERAIGLGGAYTALSDDPSGIFHNPAGIIFNYENYFSLVAYVYNLSEVKYKNALGNRDYTIKTSNPSSNFFGFTQNYGKIKWGFALVFPEDTKADQNDSFDNLNNPPTVAGKETAKSLSRRLLDQYTEGLIGLAAASEVSKDFTVGVTFFSGFLTHKTINTQYIVFNTNTSNNKKYFFSNDFYDQITYFTYPKIGFQYMPIPNWSIGGVIGKKLTFYSKRDRQSIRTATDINGLPATPTINADNDVIINYYPGSPNMLSPLEISGGVAYFPDKTTLFSADVKYYTDDPEFKSFTTVPVMNISLGLEYYFSEQQVFRTGIFTNNANTPILSNSKTNQLDHVDYAGGSITYSFLTPGSTFTLGCQYSTGAGNGQIIGDTTIQQAIEGKNVSLLMNASLQL